MRYCGPRGIPLSRFLEWDELDQDAALMWQAHESRRCTGCGTHPDEWDETRGGRRDAYVAETVVCPGCRALDTATDRQGGKANIPGAHVMLRATEEV